MGYRHWMLVEGSDDQHVLRNLLRSHGIPCAIPGRDDVNGDAIVVDSQSGVEQLIDALQVILDDSDLERVAVIVDADTNLEARWESLRRILVASGAANVPTTPDPNGTIVILEQTLRTVVAGVWIMPDNTVPGILEDFVGFLVPDGDDLYRWANCALAGIPLAERRFAAVSRSKAWIHTWLAWQEDPGTPLGWAVTKRYLDANAPQALALVGWVTRLFGIQDQA